MILEVNPHSATPPYEQVREQVTALVHAGVLPAGTRLPTIRQLAGDLGLAPGTVGRSYRELEAAGIVVGRGRHGTTVTTSEAPATATPALDAARRYARDAKRLGTKLDEALLAVRAAYAMEPE